MGSGKADAEIAKVIARHAKIQAGLEPSPASSSEWRRSRSGWGCENLPNSLKSASTADADPDPATDGDATNS